MKVARVACIAALLTLPSAVYGHGFSPGYLELREGARGRVEVLWKVPLGGESGVEGREPLSMRFPTYCREVARRAPVGVPGAVLERFALDCGPRGLGGATLALVSDESRGVDVLVTARFASGQRFSGLLRGASPTLTLPAAVGASRWSVARGYVASGVTHIATGVDHLMFVLGLLLLVRGVGALVRTVTAFTVGHSVTLALATLGLARVSQGPVEAAIAASIALLAVERSAPDDAPPSWTRRAPWITAGVFGLLHGFGFAGALAEAGLPTQNVPLALLAFNVGVELGQLAFVALVLAVALATRRWTANRSNTVQTVAVYVLGVAGTYLFLERTAHVAGWFDR